MDDKTFAVASANCCRLCLHDDGIKLPIFEGEGVQRQVAHKIQACFPILVIPTYGFLKYILPKPSFVVLQELWYGSLLTSSTVLNSVSPHQQADVCENCVE